MTRNLPGAAPEKHCRPLDPAGKGKAHAAVDATLDPLICRRFTGKITVEINLNEGGLRAIKVSTEEIFKG